MGSDVNDDDEPVPRFDSQGDELQFWKGRAQRLRSTLRDTESTLKDFEESSRELEREMEGELNASNAKSRDLQVRAEKLKGDVDELKAKYQRALTDHNKELAGLNRELSLLRESHNIYKAKLRDMELDNDELENAERMVASSLSDMESRYNRAIERTALLEEELVAKTKLEEENQRLKDELQEMKEELSIWQDRFGHNHVSSASSVATTSRPATRASSALEDTATVSSTGRGSLDLERRRPLSRTSVDRPHSRTTGLFPSTASHGTGSAPSSAAAAAAASRRAGLLASHRPSFGASQHGGRLRDSPVRGESGMSSSPSTAPFRPRHTVGAGSGRPSSTSGFVGSTATSTSSSTARLQPRTTLSSRPRVQQGSTMRKMAGLLQNLRELQATVHSATRVAPVADGHASAIPRPASRLSSSIGPSGGGGTPRRSIDGRRDDQGTPSAIPVPANGLSRSTSQRPASRLAMQQGTNLTRVPSSVRSQTPNLEHYSSLDFLDQDPAMSQHQYRRRSQLAMSTTASSAHLMSGSTMPSIASIRSGLDKEMGGAGGGVMERDPVRSHQPSSSFSSSGVRPRGSTISNNIATSYSYRREDPAAAAAARRGLQTRTKQAPPVSMRMPATSGAMARQRSSSIGSSQHN